MFSKEMIAEQQKFNTVKEFIESEIIRLTALVETYKEDIKTQGQDFNMDNPNGGMYSGMELTAIHHDMEKKMLYSQEAMDDIAYYKRLKDAPYFARVDFKIDGALQPRSVYIGLKTLRDSDGFELHVCDWRAPVASLFYEDFEGKAFYEAPKGRIEGDLLLKRQFKFKDGCLYYYIDSDIKIDDDILREVLSTSSGEHLKVIVNSIQREQNKAVRYSDNKNLLVIGPAGSGKTSVGFHRIAYLLYQNRNEVSSAEIVMISNNDIFSSYVADIIPELGEKPINYTSFYNIFSAEIPVMPVADYYALAEDIMSGNVEREASAQLKMSKEFMDYLEQRVSFLHPSFKDIVCRGEVVVTAKELLTRFINDDSSIRAKGERLNSFVQASIDEFFFVNKERIYEEINEETLISEDTKKVFDREKRSAKANALESIKQSVSFDPLKTYFDFLQRYAEEKNNNALVKSMDSLHKGYIEFEDALGILYLKTVFGTTAVLSGVKHILIDEAQDFSYIQHEILKRMFPRARVTLLADPNQAIVSNINTTSAEALVSFYEADVVRLDKSYRSTKQINEFAIKLLPEEERYQIFERDGEPVEFFEGTVEELAELIKKQKGTSQTIALVTKTADTSRELHKELVKLVPELRLCDNKSCGISKTPVIMPLALTKGLEFDSVIVVDENGCFTGEGNEKYYYLASTRALHKLSIFKV